MRHALRLAPAAALALTLAACTGPAQSPAARSAGSLGISPDGTTLYAANPDQGTVSVVNAATFKVEAEVPVGRDPSRIAVAADGRVFVSNRGSRSISVLDPKTLAQTAVLQTGAEPIGLALSADAETVFVACFTGGEVDAIDTATGTRRWSAKVDHPRGVALTKGRVLVTAFKRGTVSFLDAATGAAKVAAVNLDQNPLTMQSRVGAPTDAEQAGAVVVSQASGHAFVLDVEARNAAVATQSPDAYGGSPGASRTVPVVAAGVSTLNLHSLSLVRAAPGDLGGSATGVDPTGSGGTSPSIVPGTPLSGTPPAGSLDATRSPPPVIATDGSMVLNAPSAAVVDPTGHFLYTVFQGSDDLAIVDADGEHSDTDLFPGVWGVVKTAGQFPTGVALSADGKHLFVYNAHTYSISEIGRTAEPADAADRLQVIRTVPVSQAPTWLTPQVAEGRRLFFSATDPTLTDTSLGGISCASCHPEGRDDGRTWKFTEGPRNTPFLATGFLAQTKPFHWAGEIKSFDGFQQIVETRMGGAGLSDTQFSDILAFLQSKALLHPDNPNLAADGTLTPLQEEGKQLFSGAAGCNVCHTGVTTTDNLNHDVGTWTDLTDPSTGIEVTDMTHALQTPTLHDVFTSGPYLHNGAAMTLTQRLVDFRDDGSGKEVHGHTAGLTAHQLEALVAYVKTL